MSSSKQSYFLGNYALLLEKTAINNSNSHKLCNNTSNLYVQCTW